MAALNFPINPVQGTTFVANAITYTFDGTKWLASVTAGIQGAQGTQGRQGLQGRQGIQGEQGIQGFQGIQGIQGRQGIQGIQGRQGIQGFQGLQGTRGDTGLGFTIAKIYPTVSQLLADTNPYVEGVPVPRGQFALVRTTDPTSVDNNKVYLWTGTVSSGGQGWLYFDKLTNSSGIQGVDGTQGGQGIQGHQGMQGIQGIQGTQSNLGFVETSIVPALDKVYDLGSPTRRWKTLYLSW
jgi:hypothetical protein